MPLKRKQMPDKLYCPTFIYEICVASAVKNFLIESYSLDMIGKKYADGISEYYKPISVEEISGPAEEILRFLSERKNPMFEAHDLANHYVYWKLNFDGRSQRKLKGLFSDSFKYPTKFLYVCIIFFYICFIFNRIITIIMITKTPKT